ncbi:MAG: NADPH-dependent diflavin oxidoreductase 1, partial [Paramarteilia canceri]
MDFIEGYFDLNSKPLPHFFEALAKYSTNNLEKKRLTEFASKDGIVIQLILNILEDFPLTTNNLNYHDFFFLIPEIRPRAYSIASSFLKNPNLMNILMVFVEYKTPLEYIQYGTCSGYIAELELCSQILIKICSGSLQMQNILPTDSVLMVGPGTGVAQFISFIDECESSVRMGKDTCNMQLYFG